MDRQLPSVFIGSSTEGIDLAREVELQLKDDADTTVWTSGVFGLGGGTLESLMNALVQFDFAVIALTPDAVTDDRGNTHASPRDNMLFELGLFMGRLGRSRVFTIYERESEIKLPSDLAGVTLSPYRKRNILADAIRPACTSIIKAIRSLRFVDHRVQQQIRHLEGRQETTESRVRAIQIAIKALVTEFEYEKLCGLAADGPFMVQFHNSMIAELNRLDAIRYVRPREGYGIMSIRERDGTALKFDLKQYVEITPDGLEYLGLRREVLHIPGEEIGGRSQALPAPAVH